MTTNDTLSLLTFHESIDIKKTKLKIKTNTATIFVQKVIFSFVSTLAAKQLLRQNPVKSLVKYLLFGTITKADLIWTWTEQLESFTSVCLHLVRWIIFDSWTNGFEELYKLVKNPHRLPNSCMQGPDIEVTIKCIQVLNLYLFVGNSRASAKGFILECWDKIKKSLMQTSCLKIDPLSLPSECGEEILSFRLFKCCLITATD